MKLADTSRLLQASSKVVLQEGYLDKQIIKCSVRIVEAQVETMCKAAATNNEFS